MHEHKHILGEQVADEGLWRADLAKAQCLQEDEVTEVRGVCADTEDESEFGSSEDEQEEEDKRPVPTTTKYGRASKPPQRLGYDK